jgi:hypothetical protein
MSEALDSLRAARSPTSTAMPRRCSASRPRWTPSKRRPRGAWRAASRMCTSGCPGRGGHPAAPWRGARCRRARRAAGPGADRARGVPVRRLQQVIDAVPWPRAGWVEEPLAATSALSPACAVRPQLALHLGRDAQGLLADKRPALLVPLRHLAPAVWALGRETAATGVVSAVQACDIRWA